MSNTGSAAPTRILRSITGSGAFRRFSKIGNEPIPVLDAAKIGNGRTENRYTAAKNSYQIAIFDRRGLSELSGELSQLSESYLH